MRWRFPAESGTISNYSRIPVSMSRLKRCWRRIPDTKVLPGYTPILLCRKSVPRIIRCPNKNAKTTVRFQRNVSLWNTLSALSKGFVSSLNATATAEAVSLFAFLRLLASAMLTDLPNFARGLLQFFQPLHYFVRPVPKTKDVTVVGVVFCKVSKFRNHFL